MDIVYDREPGLAADEFIDVLDRSGLGERRPVKDRARIETMLRNASLIVTARRDGRLVGVSRAVTDFTYCCYLSDLAVDRTLQGRGIGTKLMRLTREWSGGPGVRCVLLSAPAARSFYERVGLTLSDRCFDFTEAPLG